MHKRVMILVALIALAVSAPAQAEIFGWLSSNGGPDSVVVDEPLQMSTPIQGTHIGGGFQHGYPFRGGCCEAQTSCCQGIWDDYCGGSCFSGLGGRGCGSCGLGKGKGHSCPLTGMMRGGKGGCGSACGKGGCGMPGGCGKGGCGMPGGCGKGGCGMAGGHGFGGKGGWAFSGKGGCGSCGHSGCGGACGCGTCGHGRLGLFDWLHFGHPKGCGCNSCAGGKGHVGFGKRHASHGKGCSTCGGAAVQGWPGQTDGYSSPVYHEPQHMEHAPSPSAAPIPTPAVEAPLPPPVTIEATPTSDRSAWMRGYPNGVQFQYTGF